MQIKLWLCLVSMRIVTSQNNPDSCTAAASPYYTGFQRSLRSTCRIVDGGITVTCRDSVSFNFEKDIITKNLANLSVVNCCLQKLSENDLDPAIRLRHLDLSHNMLKKMDKGTFKTTTQLVHLDLSNNLLETLDYYHFNRLFKLTYLNLKNNLLEDIDYLAFSKMKMLSYLDLNNNFLSALDYRLFNPTTKLAHLDLGSNSFEILDQRLFLNLRQLKYLNLRKNELYPLHDANLFLSQDELTTLVLGENKIVTIDVDVMKPLKSLQSLDLSSNPFVCDCDIEQTMVWCSRNGLETNATCQFPFELKEVPWEAVNLTKVCRNTRQNEFPINLIFIGTGVIISLLFVSVCCSIYPWIKYRQLKSSVDSEVDTRNLVYDDVATGYSQTVRSENVSSTEYISITNITPNDVTFASKQYDDVYLERDGTSVHIYNYARPR